MWLRSVNTDSLATSCFFNLDAELIQLGVLASLPGFPTCVTTCSFLLSGIFPSFRAVCFDIGTLLSAFSFPVAAVTNLESSSSSHLFVSVKMFDCKINQGILA